MRNSKKYNLVAPQIFEEPVAIADAQPLDGAYAEPGPVASKRQVACIGLVMCIIAMIAAFTYAKRSDSLPHKTARGSKTIVYTTPGPGRTGSGDCAAAEAVGMSQELYQRLLAASRNTAAFCNQATLQAVMAEISAGSAPEQVISSLEAANGTLDDLARKTTINTLHAGLKVYLQEHGGYPTAAQLSDETWLQANLSYVYNEVLSIAPGNTANSVTSNAEVTADAFSYIALDTLQQPCTAEPCASYTLAVRLVQSNEIYAKKSADN